MRGQRDLRLARQTQSGRPTPFDHQFHRRRGLRHFYLHETRRRLAPVPALPPATKGGVMDTLPAGKIGSGQPAAIKRPQKLSAPGGIGPRRAASLRNTTLLHDRVFITARWQLIGEPCCTAYGHQQMAPSIQLRLMGSQEEPQSSFSSPFAHISRTNCHFDRPARQRESRECRNRRRRNGLPHARRISLAREAGFS